MCTTDLQKDSQGSTILSIFFFQMCESSSKTIYSFIPEKLEADGGGWFILIGSI